MKLSTCRIGKIHNDQDLVHHYYHIALIGARVTNTYPVEGLDTRDNLVEQRGEPAKNHISKSLANENKEHTVQIDSSLDQVTKN